MEQVAFETLIPPGQLSFRPRMELPAFETEIPSGVLEATQEGAWELFFCVCAEDGLFAFDGA
jgi:hypothetical protein